jgi:hypothetical protein
VVALGHRFTPLRDGQRQINVVELLAQLRQTANDPVIVEHREAATAGRDCIDQIPLPLSSAALRAQHRLHRLGGLAIAHTRRHLDTRAVAQCNGVVVAPGPVS